MRQMFRAWPFVVAILCLLYDNKVIIPVLYAMEVPVRWYYAIPLVLAGVELIYWNWFIGWFAHWVKEQEQAREAFEKFWTKKFGGRISRLARQIHAWAVKFLKEMLDGDGHWQGWKGRLAVWCVTKLPKIMAYPLMVLLGMVPAGWLIGIPLCRSNKIPFGFTTLLLSCLFHNWLLAYFGKEWLFQKVYDVAMYLPIGVSALIILIVVLVLYTVIKRKIKEAIQRIAQENSPE